MGEPNHYRGIVRVIHERHVREIVQARIPGRGVSRRRQGPRDVAGRRGHAVAPAHAGLQSEGETLPVFRPRPRASEVGPGNERRVVAHERGEQHVALDLFGKRVHGEQRVHALEVRPRCVDHGATAVRGSRAARRDHHPSGHQPQRSSPHARILAGPGGTREIRRMLAHLGTRTLVGAVVVAGVVTLTFLLVRLAPGDPVERLLGPTATPAQLAAQRRGLAVGAWQSGAGPRVDAALSVTTVTLFALPGFWLGLMLAMAFTYWAHWLPAFGATGLDADGLTGWSRLADRLRHFALPLATLTLIGIGGAARFVRGAMRDVMSQPFVRTAEAKGLTAFQVTRRHVARNASIPIITLIGLSLPALFSGAVFVEAVFAWPGVGRRLVEAVQARDYPVVLAATAVTAVLVVIGNLLTDLGVAWIDPRIRRGKGET